MLNRGWMMGCVLALGLVAASVAPPIAYGDPNSDANAPTVRPKPIPSETPTKVPAGGPTSAPTTGPTTKPVQDDGGGLFGNQGTMMFVLIGGVILMWVLMGRSRRKEQAKHREMLANLKKGDKIQTIGGIIGTVIEVRPDEVTVKVDETNNVRMRFSRRAVHVVGDTKSDVRGDDDKDKK